MTSETKAAQLKEAKVTFEENKQACELAFEDSPLKNVCRQQAVKVFETTINQILNSSEE